VTKHCSVVEKSVADHSSEIMTKIDIITVKMASAELPKIASLVITRLT